MSNTVFDSVKDIHGGMNGNLISSIIGANQYLKGINITCRGGVARTRPGFSQHPLIFNSDADEKIFTLGKWQGAIVYNTTWNAFIVAAVSGNVFMIETSTWRVVNVTAQTGRFNQYHDRLYFCQVEQYMIVQDGINTPIIIDGQIAGKANPAVSNEVPVGTVMAYGHGRLVIKVKGNQFILGNINMPSTPLSVLQFTETAYYQGGGSFGLPKDLGEITGLAFVQNYDSGDGQGPLLVFARNGFDSFATYLPRTYWTDQEISRVQARGIGCSSQDCIIVTGDDMIFRTFEGLGSYDLYKTSQRRFTDMSVELAPIEDQETEWCRTLSSGVMFDNRVLYTLVAEKVKAKTLEGFDIDDYRFRALGVLDLSPVNGLTDIENTNAAVYDGIWTGPNPISIITGNFDSEVRCFVFGKNDQGENLLYELDDKPGNDCESERVNCRLYPRYTRFFDYASRQPVEQIYNLKRLDKASLFIPHFEGTVDFKLWVKSDSRTNFVKISEMTIFSPMVAAEPPYTNLTSGQAQSRAKLTFPQFKTNLGDPVQGQNLLHAYEYEFCLEWDGIAEIRRVSLEAVVIESEPTVAPDRNKILVVSDRSDFDYSINCPKIRFTTSSFFLFGKLVIRIGNFDYWTIDSLPGTFPLVYGSSTTDATVSFMQDPATTQGWYPSPGGSAYPAPTPPTPPSPGTPTPPGVPMLPAPDVTKHGPSGDVTTKGGNPVGVLPLPKTDDPPGDVVKGLVLATSPQYIVKRGDPVTFEIQLLKQVLKPDGSVWIQAWTNPGPGSVSLQLTPGNGDSWTQTSATAFDSTGRCYITGSFNGGSLENNITTWEATVTNGAGSFKSGLWNIDIQAVPGVLNVTGSPSFTFFSGDGSKTSTIIVTNSKLNSLLKWTATLNIISPELAGKISATPLTYSGNGLAGGASENITVTAIDPGVSGTFTAEVDITDGTDTVTVTCTVQERPLYTGSLKMNARTIQVYHQVTGSVKPADQDYTQTQTNANGQLNGGWAAHSPTWATAAFGFANVFVGRNSTTKVFEATWPRGVGSFGADQTVNFTEADMSFDGNGCPSGSKDSAIDTSGVQSGGGGNTYYYTQRFIISFGAP